MASTKTRTEKLFDIAIAVKGIDGAVQLVGALALALIPPAAIEGIAHAVVTRDLLGDPDGFLARHLSLAARDFVDGSTRTFAIVYLLLHGVVKLVLVVALYRKLVRVYPVAVLVLGAFVAYELLRASHTHSVLLVVFAVLDVVIIVLVLREYRELRGRPAHTN